MSKLRDFVLENVPLDNAAVADDELVTEVVIMYRVVKLADSLHLPERYDVTTSAGCSLAMARGISDCINDLWGVMMAEIYDEDRHHLHDDEEDEDGD